MYIRNVFKGKGEKNSLVKFSLLKMKTKTKTLNLYISKTLIVIGMVHHDTTSRLIQVFPAVSGFTL